MPRFNVKAPDGSIIPVDAPEGASEQDAIAFAASVWKPSAPAAAPAQPTPVPAAPTPAGAPEPSYMAQEAARRKAAWEAASKTDLIAGAPLARGAVGVVKPVIGAVQLGADLADWVAQKYGYSPELSKIIADHLKSLEESQQRGMAAYGDGTTDVAGMVGSAAIPTKLAGTMFTKAGVPILKRIAQGAGFGGAVGATTPSTEPGIENRMDMTAVGAAINAAIPFAAPSISMVGKGLYRSLIEPWANPAAIKGRAYLEAAGSKAPEILNAMRRPQELVPGSMPTAGEAAAGVSRPQWSAMQQSARELLPDEYLARADAQKAAQIAQLRTVGKTPKDLKAAEAARTAQADIDYPEAMAAGIKPEARGVVQPQIDELMKRPDMKGIEEEARALAKNAGVEWKGSWDSVEGLDFLKKALDARIQIASKPTYPKGPKAFQNLLQMKSDLLDIAKQLSPAYGAARERFAEASVPINQMQVGQFLENKLVPALGEETAPLRARVFSSAVRDAPATIKKSLTDAPRYTELKQVLSPEQLAAVESVEADLARQAREQLLASAGGAAGVNAGKVGTASMRDATGGKGIPNPLSTKVTILNAIIGRLEGAVDKKLALEIAEEMLKPRTAGAILHRAMAADARDKMIQNFLARGRAPAQAALTQNQNLMSQ